MSVSVLGWRRISLIQAPIMILAYPVSTPVKFPISTNSSFDTYRLSKILSHHTKFCIYLSVVFQNWVDQEERLGVL